MFHNFHRVASTALLLIATFANNAQAQSFRRPPENQEICDTWHLNDRCTSGIYTCCHGASGRGAPGCMLCPWDITTTTTARQIATLAPAPTTTVAPAVTTRPVATLAPAPASGVPTSTVAGVSLTPAASGAVIMSQAVVTSTTTMPPLGQQTGGAEKVKGAAAVVAGLVGVAAVALV
ncbi:hypothetical protein HK097_007539 [Rhizophlyctis rosea]|uniref:GPI anchored serine-threonine rich protein n=1 Tax=Rhizophlyctis rosea TaxID=64517 RepID=A0AAD5SJF4_9FUNG|nr:hypothetical protein HK097_007539 [Rhizophlyctis rosea]